MIISKRAKVKSDKPSYKKKEKSESGNIIYRYDEKHISERTKVKDKKIEKLEKEIGDVRKRYTKDLKSDDLVTRAVACIVAIIDDTAVRIGNISSMEDSNTYGATTLKVKHLSLTPSKARFKFVGKGGVDQDIHTTNKPVISVLRELIKGKKKDDFIFEVDGKRIWDRRINRYLAIDEISAKDLRGFRANKLMKDMLKTKNWEDALEETAKIVGHEVNTLKNQYLQRGLVEKHEKKKKKAQISCRADDVQLISPRSEPVGEELKEPLQSHPARRPVNLYANVDNVMDKAQFTPGIMTAWKILAPFLPKGAFLTSGYRSEEQQVNTINNFWRQYEETYKYYPNQNNWTKKDVPNTEDKRLFMTQQYDPNMPLLPGGEGINRPQTRKQIARPGKSKHQSGTAFDISGFSNVAFYPLTKRIVEWVSKHMEKWVSFSAIDEGKEQRAIHVNILKPPVYPGVEVMTHFLRKYWHGEAEPLNTKASISKRALDFGVKRVVDSLKEKYFGATTKPQVSKRDYIQVRRLQHGIQPGVKVNRDILTAWSYLKPHLPESAVMTSGARTKDDQIRIINNYWKRSGLFERYPDVFDPYEKSRLLIQNGWIVGPPTSKGKNVHLTGRAFDVSGANLNEIAAAARKVSEDPSIPVSFSQILIEKANNATHLGIGDVRVASISKRALDLSDFGMGFEDRPGDWWEKNPIFRHREEPEYAAKDVKLEEAKKLAKDEPEEFFYRGLHKEYEDLEIEALRNMLDVNAKFYWIFSYYNRDGEFKDLMQEAAEKLSYQDPRAFFYYELHKKYPEMGRGAVIKLINEDPRSYEEFGLGKFYPDYEQAATDAISIYDATKVDVRERDDG